MDVGTLAEARRAGARIVELKGSHVIMVSQPKAVTDLILHPKLVRFRAYTRDLGLTSP
jgi:hypothetical protein